MSERIYVVLSTYSNIYNIRLFLKLIKILSDSIYIRSAHSLLKCE